MIRKAVQICCNKTHLYALDDAGGVWVMETPFGVWDYIGWLPPFPEPNVNKSEEEK